MTEVLPALVDAWVGDRRIRSRRGMSQNTERAYRNDLATFARRLIGPAQPSVEAADNDPWGLQNRDIQRLSIDAFTDANLARVFGQMVDDGAATSSRARMLSTLRGFTRWLIVNGYLDTDPTLRFETPQPDRKLPVALNDDQLAAVVDAAAKPRERLRSHWPTRDLALLGILAGCGLRSEELTGLKIAALQRAEPHRIRVLGKGSKERVLPVSVEMLDAIDAYLAERTDADLGGTKPSDTLFVRRNGASLDNRSLQRLVTNWLAAAGIPPPPGEKAHLFRHTYGIAQIDRGTSLPELQSLMGHENIATTSTYLRVASDGLHHTARSTAVNELLRANITPTRLE